MLPLPGPHPGIYKSFSLTQDQLFFSEYVRTVIETKYQNYWEKMAKKADKNWEWKNKHTFY